jgi:glutamate carboxypeptidase
MVSRIIGNAAHSGGNFTEGISAMEELARKVQALHAITDLDRRITLNVGLVSGGQSVNTVAPWAEPQIDPRYVSAPDRDDAMARVRAIIEQSYVLGTKAELTVQGAFLPWSGPGRQAAVRTLRAVRSGHRFCDRGRIRRRLCRLMFHRGCGRSNGSCCRSDWRQNA